ncbi:hypothetical protein BUALT_Bualt06G0009000 [Buddleja alternifolia]|uniref:Retrotransposon gag domain-containing protein n=1 Tax=Buddleja alternifolia TaxID=168488 RepID=A0AAV6XC05_9LAMI|nr:hypothetical protein BUALT_Bualt06G0009000 [Buddleja alternifolia]
MSWILGSVDPSILLNLKPYKTSRQMWAYLKKVYNQSNIARRFQLELKLGLLVQGSMSIQDFYSSFENIWAEYIDIVYASVPEGVFVVQSSDGSIQGTFYGEPVAVKQIGSVDGFVNQFIQNANQIPKLTDEHYMGYFMNGLHETICDIDP